MEVEEARDVPHYCCGDCIHHNWDRCRAWYLPCKRIDHDKIKFAKPWFAVYDAHQFSGVICRDFEPKRTATDGTWTGFDDYWPAYVEQWLPYGDTDKLMYFTLGDCTDIRYGVPLMEFVNGTMLDGNKLKAVEKMWYQRKQNDPIGYKLTRREIDGVEVPEWNGLPISHT